MTVTPAQNTIAINQALSVTVQVSGSSGTPTGNVTIAGGGYDGGAATLASGSYTFNIPAGSLTAGTYKLTGSYPGNSTYAEASGTASIAVNKALPTVNVALSPSSIGAGTAVTVDITVSGGGGPTPTGTIQLSYYDRGGLFTPYCPLVSGSCQYVIIANSLPNGNDAISVSYPGDSNYLSASGSATETVNALTPVVTATATPASVTTSSSFQVAVNVTGSGATPTGSVGVFMASSQLSGQLSNGAAAFTVPPFSLYAGTHSLGVDYAGDTTYLPTNGSAAVTVNPTPTTISIVPASTSIYTNQALVVSGTISGGTQSPTGLLTVAGGGFSASSGNYTPQYSFTIPPGSLAAGADTLTITYGGDGFYSGSNNSTTVNVTQFTRIQPTITVTPQLSSFGNNEPVSVSISVSGAEGTGTGTVSLSYGSWVSPAWLLEWNGTQSITIPAGTLPVGTDTITASYSGDPSYLSATANANITVTTSTFTLTAGSAPNLNPGQQGSIGITAQTSSGYYGQVTLSCALTQQPTGAVDLPTCAGVTIQVLGSSNGGNVTVSTTGATASLARPRLPGLGTFGGAALAFLVFLGIPARRRGWRSLLGAVVLGFVFFGMGACGGGGNSGGVTGGGSGGGGTSGGTTAGTYTFTVTGTGNPAVSPAPTTTFTLKVN